MTENELKARRAELKEEIQKAEYRAKGLDLEKLKKEKYCAEVETYRKKAGIKEQELLVSAAERLEQYEESTLQAAADAIDLREEYSEVLHQICEIETAREKELLKKDQDLLNYFSELEKQLAGFKQQRNKLKDERDKLLYDQSKVRAADGRDYPGDTEARDKKVAEFEIDIERIEKSLEQLRKDEMPLEHIFFDLIPKIAAIRTKAAQLARV